MAMVHSSGERPRSNEKMARWATTVSMVMVARGRRVDSNSWEHPPAYKRMQDADYIYENDIGPR